MRFCAALLLALPLGATTRNELLWIDPGRVERLDFRGGPGGRKGAPRPPFRLLKEDSSGSNAKLFVRDARGRTWNVKFGPEVHSEVFASRVAWAAGYFVQPTYLVSRGRIGHAVALSRRAKNHLSRDGRFTNARFQLRDARLKFLEQNDWSWTYNPFVGSRELSGLKVVLMLTSNWDNKDARDIDRGSNTAIFRKPGRPRYLYAFVDWGQTMGRWGGPGWRSSWDCGGYAADTPGFVRGVKGGEVKFGYSGQHTGEFTDDILVDQVRWLLKYVGRIRDRQLWEGLLASGATRQEAGCFVRELRTRIRMLETVVGNKKRVVRASTAPRAN